MGHEVIVDGSGIHKCDLPKQGTYSTGKQYNNGTIIACDECGSHWFLHRYRFEDNGAVYGDWNRVRWYHWKKIRKIAKA